MAKPQIVLVPGAWHTIAYFSTLIAKLQELGYTVHARQLASVGNPNPPKDLTQDVAIVNGMVEEAIGDGNDVVVICHSWGGLITGCSLAGLSKKEREAAGKKGGVVRTGYIAAFIAPEGVSLVECIPGGKPEPWWIIDESSGTVLPGDRDKFYNDLSEAEKQHWFSLIEPHALSGFYSKATYESWKHIPSRYLLCELDQAFPAVAQEGMSGMVKAMGGEIEVTRIVSGHSPFLSRLEETMEWVKKVIDV